MEEALWEEWFKEDWVWSGVLQVSFFIHFRLYIAAYFINIAQGYDGLAICPRWWHLYCVHTGKTCDLTYCWCNFIKVIKPILDPLKDENGELPEPASVLCFYFENTYIGMMVGDRYYTQPFYLVHWGIAYRFKKPTTEPSQWSHHKHLAGDLPLTDNKVEGWHKWDATLNCSLVWL